MQFGQMSLPEQRETDVFFHHAMAWYEQHLKDDSAKIHFLWHSKCLSGVEAHGKIESLEAQLEAQQAESQKKIEAQQAELEALKAQFKAQKEV